MYPIVIVDGKEYEVDNIDFYKKGEIKSLGVFINNEYKKFSYGQNRFLCNEKYKKIIYGQLKWVDRYTEVLKDIEQVIDEKSELMTTLAHEEMYRKRDLPFSDNKKEREYFDKERELIGLLHAQEIIENLID